MRGTGAKLKEEARKLKRIKRKRRNGR